MKSRTPASLAVMRPAVSVAEKSGRSLNAAMILRGGFRPLRPYMNELRRRKGEAVVGGVIDPDSEKKVLEKTPSLTLRVRDGQRWTR